MVTKKRRNEPLSFHTPLARGWVFRVLGVHGSERVNEEPKMGLKRQEEMV